MNPYLLGICGYALWKFVSAILDDASDTETASLVDKVKQVVVDSDDTISSQTLRIVKEYERRKSASLKL